MKAVAHGSKNAFFSPYKPGSHPFQKNEGVYSILAFKLDVLFQHGPDFSLHSGSGCQENAFSFCSVSTPINTKNNIISILLSDVQVTCQVSEDCVLPCRFEPSGGEKIEWYKYNGILIFSYSKITYQSNRVLVSTKQLELGNATLVLQQSELQDRGRYTCKVISAEKERNVFVLVKIEGG